jgi:hypothetical protein
MTQKEQIKAHFLGSGSISQIEAFTLYKIMRLSERIREMERKGWVFAHLTMHKNKKRFTEYCLIKRGA